MYNFSRSNILSFTHTTKNYNNVLRTTLLCLQQFNEFGASYSTSVAARPIPGGEAQLFPIKLQTSERIDNLYSATTKYVR